MFNLERFTHIAAEQCAAAAPPVRMLVNGSFGQDNIGDELIIAVPCKYEHQDGEVRFSMISRRNL